MSEIGKLPSITSFESKPVLAGNTESSIEIESYILKDTSEVEVVIPSEGLVIERRSDSENIDTNSAVQTREQVRKETVKKRPLKVTVVDELNITSDEFRVLQESDEKL